MLENVIYYTVTGHWKMDIYLQTTYIYERRILFPINSHQLLQL